MVTECMVHSVAQGLFYSGVIKNDRNRFTFIYDCGTDEDGLAGDTALLNTSIARHKPNLNGVLDLLFISHFHKDHISGIPKLLKDVTVKTVVIPYIDDITRLLYLASYDEITAEVYEILIDPEGYFFERGADTVILLGSPDDDPDGIVDRGYHPEGEMFSISSPHDEVARVRVHGETSRDRRPTRSFSYSKDIIIHIRIGWEFLTFCDASAINSMTDVRDEIAALVGDNINEYLNASTEGMLKDLKKIYNDYAGSQSLNKQSVLVISRPISSDEYVCCSRSFFTPGRSLESSAYTSLLLGDYPFTRNTIVANKFLQDNIEKYEILAVILPHHGSEKGLNKAIMPYLDEAVFFIASYGEDRVVSRNHPHMHHLSNVIGKPFLFIPVSDSCMFEYAIKVC